MNFKQIVCSVIIATSFAATAVAQVGKSSLTGAVSDGRGGALQGAQITVDPGNTTAVTDAQGLFTITALNAGEYTVSVKYSGFETNTRKVTLAAGQPVRLDTTLKVSATSENVDVYAGRAGGEVEAINRTFTADNIINVLPADVITSLPNANVADAIGRLPSVTLERDEGEGKYVQVRGTEPRLTNTTLDGVNLASAETVRQIKLDLIPADLVESVQINKTLQANMGGDGIGGSVDLRTKSAESRPTFSLESLGGYNPIINGRPNYQFDGTLGKRFLVGQKLGALIGGSYDWNGRGIDDVEPGPALTGTYDLREYQYYRDRWGIAGTTDYRFSDTSSIYLKGLYSHFNNFGSRWVYTPTINTFVSALQGDVDGNMSSNAQIRRPVQDIGGLQLGGHHVLRSALLNWDLNSSLGRTQDKGYATANFVPQAANNPLNNVTFKIDVTNPLEPKINAQNGVNIFDATKYFYSGQSIQYFYNPEVDLGFGGSLAVPYSIGGHASTVEFGGRFRNEHKFENQDTRVYVPTASNPEDPTLAMSNFLGSFTNGDYYHGAYKFGPTVDYNKVTAFTAQVQKASSSVIGNQFNQIEKVSAGYVMNTSNLGKFRLVLGVRIEATDENNKGYSATKKNSTSATGTKVTATGGYIDVLPSASLRFAISPSQGLRLVYGRGLARPNFSDLVPFQTVNSSGGANNSVSLGNPNLKAEYADNVDLLYEGTLHGNGLVQAGFFYKNLTDPIVATKTKLPATDPNFPNYFQSQTINAGSAWVYGFEVAFQQHFTYLPGFLNGLGLSSNYAYTASQANLPVYNANPTAGQIGGAVNRGSNPDNYHPALLRQSPNTFNISPTYDKRNLSIRYGLTYNQANIYAYAWDGNTDPIGVGGSGGGPNGPNGDNYLYTHLQMDIQGSYKLPMGFQAVAYVLNLNNEVFGFYNGGVNYSVQREFYRQTFGGGLRWSPVSHK